jgi:hypothetical protein
MMTTQNRRRKKNKDVPAPLNRAVAPGLNRNLNEFLQSLGDVLIDITALEVNTMVVERIPAHKFIAWEAYRDIYPISQEYLQDQGIHELLRDRYLELRLTLERQYRALLSDPSSELFDPTALNSVNEEARFATDPDLHSLQTLLPDPFNLSNPEEIIKVQRVLKTCHFLRCLRKVSEFKTVLDSRNMSLYKQETEPRNSASVQAQQATGAIDAIYAQTIIQLDGEVINRYSQDIIGHPHQDLILQLHRDGVTSSEKQWRGLMEFIVGLVQASLQWGKDVSPWGSAKTRG